MSVLVLSPNILLSIVLSYPHSGLSIYSRSIALYSVHNTLITTVLYTSSRVLVFVHPDLPAFLITPFVKGRRYASAIHTGIVHTYPLQCLFCFAFDI